MDKTSTCAFCRRVITVNNAQSSEKDWHRIRGEHEPDCDWYLTRAHRCLEESYHKQLCTDAISTLLDYGADESAAWRAMYTLADMCCALADVTAVITGKLYPTQAIDRAWLEYRQVHNC